MNALKMEELNEQQYKEMMEEVDEWQSQDGDENSEWGQRIKERFKITSLDQLNWAFRKISALLDQEREIKALADAERFRINEWEKKEMSGIEQSKDFFTSIIHEYHAAQLEENPKVKTLTTPYGKSKSRVTKEQPEKGDEEEILAHVKANGLDRFIKESVKWADLKKSLRIAVINGQKVVIDEDGQIVPGVGVKPESITYSVEVE